MKEKSIGTLFLFTLASIAVLMYFFIPRYEFISNPQDGRFMYRCNKCTGNVERNGDFGWRHI